MSEFLPHLLRALHGQPLREAESEAAFSMLISGAASEVEIAAFLVALRQRGESIDEITGAARALRAKAHIVVAPKGVIDTCGTGGDGSHSFNISTAAAIVAAGAGAVVAKHGNKAASSRSGSADVLAALGVNLDADDAAIARSFQEAHIAFLYAPVHHQAMRHVAAVRRALQVRTLFNLLGPLANPAGATLQLIGVFDPGWARPIAEVAARLGAEKLWVVHGAGGLDELSTLGDSRVVEYADGNFREFTLKAADHGLPLATIADLRGGEPADNAVALERLLAGEPGAYRDIVCLNAGAALIVADLATDIRDGIAQAQRAIDSGAAAAVLQRWVNATGTR